MPTVNTKTETHMALPKPAAVGHRSDVLRGDPPSYGGARGGSGLHLVVPGREAALCW